MDLTDRFLHWSMRQVTPGWLTGLLGMAALFILAWSIQDAAWVPDSSPISFNLFAGAFVGLCLALTRWGGGWAALYTTLLGVAFTLQDLGRIVPPLGVIFATPPLALVELMNVRLFAMLQRMGGWLSLYQSGETIHDTGLFLLLFALLGWLTGAWLSWCLRRTRRALAGVFPAGLLLGANVNFSAQDPWMLTFFLLVVMALAARTALAGAYAGWERRGVDYPEGLGMGWAGWAGGGGFHGPAFHGGFHHPGFARSRSRVSLGTQIFLGDPFWWGPPAPYVPPVGQESPPVYAAPPVTYWYYCSNPAGYYPYVQQCPGGWVTVAPSAP